MILALILCGAVSADDYVGGQPLTTENGMSGTVSGGLYYDVNPAPNWGDEDVTKTFTLPEGASADIQEARLYVSAYCGHMREDNAFTITNKFDGDGDGIYEITWSETGHGEYTFIDDDGNDNTALGGGPNDPYLMINDHENRVTSDYLMWYDVTELITADTVNVNVNTGDSDDGRIKMISLIVAYNDGDNDQIMYWVNQGHDVCSYYTEPDYPAIGTTTFDTSSITGTVEYANLTIDYLASNNGYYGFPTSANNFTCTGLYPPEIPVIGSFTNQALDREPDVQGSYSGVVSWNVTSEVSQGEDVTLAYSRYFPATGTAAFFKIVLAILTVNLETANAPVADFTATPLTGTARNVTFNDTSTNNPTSWKWEYKWEYNKESEWVQFSTEQNPTHYFTAGAYDIRLTASNSAGSDVLTKTHYVSVATGREPLTTIWSGVVSGDLYISSPSTWNATEVNHTFIFPNVVGNNIDWAALFVNTYSGSAANTYGLNSTVRIDTDGYGYFTFDEEIMDIASDTSGNSYPLNDHVTKVYGDYEAWYDLRGYILPNNRNLKVNVKSSPLPGRNFDGRIKALTLIVAYSDGDSDQIYYWVNHGHDWSSPGNGETTFNTTRLVPGWASAESTIRYISGSDANYTINNVSKPNSVPLNYGGALNTWDVTDNISDDYISTLAYSKTKGSYKTTLATLAVKYLPDLVVSELVAPDNPTAGETYSVTATLSNIGIIAANNFDVRLYDNDRRIIQNFATLAAGNSTTVTFDWTPITSGEHNLQVIANKYNKINEFNTNNNQQSIPVYVSENRPDLIVADLLLPGNATAGQTYTVTATVSNMGFSDANNFDVRLYDNNVRVALQNFATLEVLDSTIVTFSWTPTTSGAHNLQIIANKYDKISEFNTDNNQQTLSMNVSENRPDLIITSLQLPDNPTAGQNYTVTATLTNNGLSAANNFDVRLYDNNTRVALQNFATLEPGNSTTVTFSWTPTTSGEHNLQVIANKYNKIIESNITNNQETREIIVN